MPSTAIIGLGVSGIAVAEYLTKQGKEFVIYDEQPNPEQVKRMQAINSSARIITMSFDSECTHIFKTIVLSPGVSPKHIFIQSMLTSESKMTNDIEMFLQVAKSPTIGITGSNGKSTTCRLTEHALTSSGYTVYCGGNIGVSALSLLNKPTPDYYLLELSSFQLEVAQHYKIFCGAILNISEDHLDRHKTFTDYFNCKISLVDHCERLVINRDDQSLKNISHNRIEYFSQSSPSNSTHILPKNISAVQAIINSLSLDITIDEKLLQTFTCLPYRNQIVCRINGITFINDSKSTNPGCVIEALNHRREPVILILGGQSKGVDISILAPFIKEKTILVILFGESAQLYEQLCITHNLAYKIAKSVRQAVVIAYQSSIYNDVILFSPGGASFDLFPKGYQQRGLEFNQAVFSQL